VAGLGSASPHGKLADCPADPGTSFVPIFRLKELPVPATCDICGKKPGFGNTVSHSHRRTRRRWNPNIQTVRTVVGGTPKRLNVCTSCLKAGRVTRAI
jgi:large subunit ribosomal protein L28